MPYTEVPFYKEVQRFTDNKIMLAVLILLGLGVLFLAYGLIRQLFFGQVFGNQPMSNSGLIFMFLFVALLFFWLVQLRLVTQVTTEGISIHFSSLSRFKRKVQYEDIQTIEIVSYNGLTDHGGWGWRIGKFGKAYTVYGNQAVKITLQGHKLTLSGVIFIGSQSASELASAIKKNLAPS